MIKLDDAVEEEVEAPPVVQGHGQGRQVEDRQRPASVALLPALGLAGTSPARSLMVLGGPGVGKTYFMSRLAVKLRSLLGRSAVAVTSPYGLLASSVGGQTLHAWAGVQPCCGTDVAAIAAQLRPAARRRWTSCTALLIIDVSPLDAMFFDLLEGIARSVRQTDAFFGGILLLIEGDFLQLGAIREKGHTWGDPLFHSQFWDSHLSHPDHSLAIHLVRQRRFTDPDNDGAVLDALRVGRASQDHINRLLALHRPLPMPTVFACGPAMVLAFRKATVAKLNEKHLTSLAGSAIHFPTCHIEKPHSWRAGSQWFRAAAEGGV